MARDRERIERVRDGLREAGLAAVVCAFPSNVLMLSGYWPVVGTSMAVVTAEGELGVVAPEDEKELAERSGADVLLAFQPLSLKDLTPPEESVLQPLQELARKLGIKHGRVGYEAGWMSEPSSYAAMTLYAGETGEMLSQALPKDAVLEPADALLARPRGVKTPTEIERLREACRIAGEGFDFGSRRLRTGVKESEAVGPFRSRMRAAAIGNGGIERADAFVYCMSGPNSAKAYGAYARSRARQIEAGDMVLVHCNSYTDGYWTDITRTYCMAPLRGRAPELYDAVEDARRAALESIAGGLPAAAVDAAAREVLKSRGFGKEFRHPTGHGVGFGAIDPHAVPRLHPKSPDVLETGMVFNVEPAIYIEGYGGVRHCDVVAITNGRAEVLTPWQSGIKSLLISGDKSSRPAA